MFTKKARIFVCILLCLIGLFSIYNGVIEIALVALLLIAYVIWDYYKEGTLVLVAKQYQAENYEKAKELLLAIKKPELLAKRRRPYYEFLYGNIALKQLNYQEAEEHLEKASQLGLRKGDYVTCLLTLSNIALRRGNKLKGLAWIAEAKKVPLTARQNSVLDNIEKELQKIK